MYGFALWGFGVCALGQGKRILRTCIYVHVEIMNIC